MKLFKSVRLTLVGIIALLSVTCGNSDAEDKGVIRYTQPIRALENTGFEAGQSGWKTLAWDMVGAGIEVDSLEAYEGNWSLKIDLASAQFFSEPILQLMGPWLTLDSDKPFQMSVFIKSDRPSRKIKMRLLGGITKKQMRKKTQGRRRITERYTVTSEWQEYTLAGTTPATATEAYRLVVELNKPGIYWIDNIDLQIGGRSVRRQSQLEAGLQLADMNKKVYDAGSQAAVEFWAANYSDRSRRIVLDMKRSAEFSRSAGSNKTLRFDLPAQQTVRQIIPVELPSADIHRLQWTVEADDGQKVKEGAVILAAANPALAAVPGGDPVWGMHFSALNLDAMLPILERAGILHLRNVVNFYWHLLERRQGRRVWPDASFEYLTQKGFHVLGTLGFPPKWASVPAKPGGTNLLNKMPRSLDEFGDYVRAVVERYGDKVELWEIWNEPNLPRYFEGTAVEYGEILNTAVAAIKAVRPELETGGFSLAWSDDELHDYLRTAFSRVAHQPDAISIHPYEKTAPEDAGMTAKIERLRDQIRQSKNYEPEFWITEAGYRARDSVNLAIPYISPPRPRTVNAMTQADYLVRHALLAKSTGVKYYFWYAMDSERNKRGPDIHGLIDYDWAASPKPALLAYMTLAQLCGDIEFQERLAIGDGETYALRFRRQDGRDLTVCWHLDGEAKINVPDAWGDLEAFDMFGNPVALSQRKLSLTSHPVYLVGKNQ